MHSLAFLEAKMKSASVKSPFVMDLLAIDPIQQLESHPDI